jgi:hypothetical protein
LRMGFMFILFDRSDGLSRDGLTGR